MGRIVATISTVRQALIARVLVGSPHEKIVFLHLWPRKNYFTCKVEWWISKERSVRHNEKWQTCGVGRSSTYSATPGKINKRVSQCMVSGNGDAVRKTLSFRLFAGVDFCFPLATFFSEKNSAPQISIWVGALAKTLSAQPKKLWSRKNRGIPNKNRKISQNTPLKNKSGSCKYMWSTCITALSSWHCFFFERTW